MTGLRPIRHGTMGGYRAHYRRGESPCVECRGARSAYDIRRHREKGGRPRSAGRYTSIPTGVLADLYLNAPLDVLQRVEAQIPRVVLDLAVAYYDNNEDTP